MGGACTEQHCTQFAPSDEYLFCWSLYPVMWAFAALSEHDRTIRPRHFLSKRVRLPTQTNKQTNRFVVFSFLLSGIKPGNPFRRARRVEGFVRRRKSLSLPRIEPVGSANTRNFEVDSRASTCLCQSKLPLSRQPHISYVKENRKFFHYEHRLFKDVIPDYSDVCTRLVIVRCYSRWYV